MKLLDINTFFNYKAGGIRTYHKAKIEFYKSQIRQQYTLVYPGPKFEIKLAAPNVKLIQLKGLGLTQDKEGYRLLWNPLTLSKAVALENPDVIEVGDPWLSAVYCLFNPKLKGKVKISMYHSDPVDTYFYPWARRSPFSKLLIPMVKFLDRGFYFLQSKYDATVVSSKAMRQKLLTKNVGKVFHANFGISHSLFCSRELLKKKWENWQNKPLRILYAGRLDSDKGIELVLNNIDKILSLANVELSVAGRGKMTEFFQNYRAPNFKFLGYISEPGKLEKLYQSHHMLLSPGPFETFGLGALEAMASGMVVVGPNAGGVGELLSSLNSPLMFPSQDSVAFLSAISNYGEWDLKALALKSYDLALEYGNWDSFFQKQLEFYFKFKKTRELETLN